MTLKIVVRAGDPDRAAEVLGALGVRTEAPNRPNPDAWTLRTTVSLVVTAAGDRRPGIYIGPDAFDDALDAAAEIVEAESVTVRRDGEAGEIDIGDGLAILVERDAPMAEPHDVWDTGLLHTIKPMFDEHINRMRECLANAGATNPRLVGNRLGRMAGATRWLLVVDADDDADLGPVDRLLTEVGRGWAPVEVRRSAAIEPDHLAEIDRRAFEI